MGTKKPSGSNSKGNDIRAGGGYFELFARDNLTKVLDRISARVKAFGSMMSKVGGGLLKGGAALGAGPLALLFGGGSRLAETAQLARQMQVPIELMGKFQHAAERAGVSVEEVMNDTKGRFSDLLNQAPLIDPDEAKAALQIQTDFKDSIRALQDALTPLLKIISPIVTEVSNFIKENAGLIKVVAGVAAALFGVGAAFSLAGPLITIVGAAFGVLSSVVGAIMTPIGLVGAAFAGMVALFLTQTEAGVKIVGDLRASFRDMGETFSTVWGGVVNAVKAGNLELAFKIVTVGIKTVWAQLMLALRQGWNDFMNWTVEALRRNPWILPLIGGVVGGLVGGPMGALAGAGAGAAGALALEVYADEVKNGLMADVDGAKKRVDALKAELGGLRAQAAREVAAVENKPRDYQGGPKPADRFAEVKGGFDAASSLSQFGYGSKVSVETEIQKGIRVAAEKTAAEAKRIAESNIDIAAAAKKAEDNWEKLRLAWTLK